MEEISAITTNAPGGGVQFRKLNLPVPEKYDVLLKPIYTGICGTDRGLVSGSLPFAYNPEGFDYLVVGHESVCSVVESRVGEFREGDIVVPVVRRPGDCPNCRIGRPDNCSDGNKHEAGITGMHGFMRSVFPESSEYIVKVQDKSMEKLAVLTEPLKNVMKAFEVFNTVSKRAVYQNSESTLEGKKCVVIGTGNEGFLYSLMANETGFDTTITNRHPLGSLRNKITDDLNLNFSDYSESFDHDFRSGIDLLIDTSGDPGTVLKFLRKVNYNGIVIFFGTNGRAPESGLSGSDIDYIVERNITIAGSVDAAKIHYIQALEYLKKWKYSSGHIESLITGEFSPDFTDLFRKKQEDEIKSVISWE